MAGSVEKTLAILGLVTLSAGAACGRGNYDHLPPVPKPPVVAPNDPRMAPDWNLSQADGDIPPAFGPQLPSPDIFMSRWADWRRRVDGVGGRVALYEANGSMDVLAPQVPLYNSPDLTGRSRPQRRALPKGGPYPYQTMVEVQIGAQRWLYAGMIVDPDLNRLVRIPTGRTLVKAALIQRSNELPVMVDRQFRGVQDFPRVEWPSP